MYGPYVIRLKSISDGQGDIATLKPAGDSMLCSTRPSRGVLIVIMLSAVFLLLPSCRKPAPHKELPPPTVGTRAPSFALKDVSGQTISLSDFNGKIVVVDFWATWCLPCRETTQELSRLYSHYKDKGVVILGVNMDGGGGAVEKVKDFAGEYDLIYSMLIDDGTASKAYYVNKIPVTFILDREHVIVKIYPGYRPGLGKMISEEIERRL